MDDEHVEKKQEERSIQAASIGYREQHYVFATACVLEPLAECSIASHTQLIRNRIRQQLQPGCPPATMFRYQQLCNQELHRYSEGL